MQTYRIHIEGIVQGVGFRPFVKRLAERFEISGTVQNGLDGVRIIFNAKDPDHAQIFLDTCVSEAPKQSRIDHYSMELVDSERFDQFELCLSAGQGVLNAPITPDQGLCKQCSEELLDPANIRYGYPFISCTDCGPRYSILNGMPFDRETTTMDLFPMCSNCEKEYNNVDNRRFYSQINSCPECGIQLSLWTASGELEMTAQEKVDEVIKALRSGFIVAVKGIGGFLLLCDASNTKSIQLLRERKVRPDKPFAVLCPSLESIQSNFIPSTAEQKALQSAAAPIVILKPRKGNLLDLKFVSPGLDSVGTMLPYAPLLKVIANQFMEPLVATSANKSGQPLIYKYAEELLDLADIVLDHNREVTFPQDDSVVRFTPFTDHQIVMRRSRGLAPSYMAKSNELDGLLAVGAEMKGTFAVGHCDQVYISQYLGQLGSFDNQENYKYVLNKLTSMIGCNPEVVLHDLHEQYFTTELASEYTLEQISVQHHEAHMMAVLYEHSQLESNEPVLGVVWDGTGAGTDGAVWGSEYMVYDDGHIDRLAHWDYFPVIAGDKMSKEPRLSALAILGENSGLEKKFTNQEWSYYSKLRKQESLQTSSMGRIFDAVASVLGLIDVSSYEGQAAMLLEQLALKFYIENGPNSPGSYDIPLDSLNTYELLDMILDDVCQEIEPNKIAAKFMRRWLVQLAI